MSAWDEFMLVLVLLAWASPFWLPVVLYAFFGAHG